MRYALVNGLKVEPAPSLSGQCSSCGAVMVAKCGQHKLWHWAHKSRVHCDPWWEPETDWHRAWKNHFPPEWQEVVHFDPASHEKHVADVKTVAGKVIEFQHSR
ncbi:MAG: competence protein CoiA family protein [Terriglobia bacterium]